jgi:hypothetical protein
MTKRTSFQKYINSWEDPSLLNCTLIDFEGITQPFLVEVIEMPMAGCRDWKPNAHTVDENAAESTYWFGRIVIDQLVIEYSNWKADRAAMSAVSCMAGKPVDASARHMTLLPAQRAAGVIAMHAAAAIMEAVLKQLELRQALRETLIEMEGIADGNWDSDWVENMSSKRTELKNFGFEVSDKAWGALLLLLSKVEETDGKKYVDFRLEQSYLGDYQARNVKDALEKTF